MHTRRLRLLLCLLSSLCSVCDAQVTPSPYQVLNGNWRILPATDPSDSLTTLSSLGFQSFVVTLAVDGDRIYGDGHLDMKCGRERLGIGLFLDGQILSDGSFTLSNPSVYRGLSADSFVVEGSLPAPGAIVWRGRFSSHVAWQNHACTAEEGEVLVTQLPLLTGTYAGMIRDGNDSVTSEITMEIAQGNLISTSLQDRGLQHCVPKSVKITMTGTSEPFVGVFARTANSDCSSKVSGSAFTQEIPAGDGGSFGFAGFVDYSDSKANTFNLGLTYVPKHDPRESRRTVWLWGELKRR